LSTNAIHILTATLRLTKLFSLYSTTLSIGSHLIKNELKSVYKSLQGHVSGIISTLELCALVIEEGGRSITRDWMTLWNWNFKVILFLLCITHFFFYIFDILLMSGIIHTCLTITKKINDNNSFFFLSNK